MKRFWVRVLAVAGLSSAWALGQPVFLPQGAEGLDLSRYDVQNRAPRFSLSGSSWQIHAPKLKPDPMPRTLIQGAFRYVGASNMGVRLEDGTTQEYYCPGRLSTALKMTEWLSDTPVVVGVYQGAEGRLGVVSAFADTVVDLPETGVKVPSGWTRISQAAAPELVLRAPVGESFLGIVSGGLEPQVVLSSQPVLATSGGDGLQIYREQDSPWRVATWRRQDRSYALICPVQDFAVMLSAFQAYVSRFR